ncbi:hypothetical protein [Bremerella cremea]|uniref:hypothetical protein n=1 Tax=Bremerella cremea TaxID=1031537 RepID=UPI0031E69346
MHSPNPSPPISAEEDRHAAQRTWLSLLHVGRHPLVIWLLNAAVLISLAGWIIYDARVTATWNQLEFDLGLTSDVAAQDDTANWLLVRSKVVVLATIVTLSIISFVVMALGMVAGSRGYRTLASMMVVLSLTCCWLALVSNWEEMVWTGRRLRIDTHIAAFEPIVESLRQDWPSQDGDREELGPFMAYPADKPMTLLLLTTPPIADDGPTFSSVEKSPSGAIRFQLSGNERGVWLEWHPTDDVPASFIGGLQEPHHLQRAISLGDGWYLARYQQAAVSS